MSSDGLPRLGKGGSSTTVGGGRLLRGRITIRLDNLEIQKIFFSKNINRVS